MAVLHGSQFRIIVQWLLDEISSKRLVGDPWSSHFSVFERPVKDYYGSATNFP